jgi:hypothetical protein
MLKKAVSAAEERPKKIDCLFIFTSMEGFEFVP